MRALISFLLLVAIAGSVRAQGTVTLRGVVIDDSTGALLAGAEIFLNGGAQRTTSDESGAFTVPGLRSGEQVITIRLIGFGPLTTAIDIAPADTGIIEFALVRNVTRLAPTTILGERDPLERSKLADFFRRKQYGIGSFLGRDLFENAMAKQTADILRLHVAGLRILSSHCSTAAYVVSSRISGSIENNEFIRVCGRILDRRCPAAIYLDGVPVYRGMPGEAPFNINQITPAEIAAVEAYAGTSELPSEFRGTGRTCAALAIWLK